MPAAKVERKVGQLAATDSGWRSIKAMTGSMGMRANSVVQWSPSSRSPAGGLGKRSFEGVDNNVTANSDNYQTDPS